MKTVKLNCSEPCVNWMRKFMQASRKTAAEVTEAGKSQGYSDSELRLAKKELQIKSVKQTTRGPWFWYLPEHLGDKSQGTATTADVAGNSPDAYKKACDRRVPERTGVVSTGPELPPAGKSKNNSDKSGTDSEGGDDWLIILFLAIAAAAGVFVSVVSGGRINKLN